MKRKKVLKEVKKVVEKEDDLESKLNQVCRLLNSELEGYDWVGFYFVENDELVLGPYVGDPTDHTNIDFGEGVCGQAADREETYLVDDVNQEKNYLSCSPRVKSEIVVPIFKEGEVVGEIDIDSHERANFGKEDKELLKDISKMIENVI